jgi:hypothetical protein
MVGVALIVTDPELTVPADQHVPLFVRAYMVLVPTVDNVYAVVVGKAVDVPVAVVSQ